MTKNAPDNAISILILTCIAVLSMIVQFYLVWRDTALVCGENTVLLYRLLKYEDPMGQARIMQDRFNTMTNCEFTCMAGINPAVTVPSSYQD